VNRKNKKITNRIPIAQELELPNGMVLPNRIAKAPMTERIAKSDHAPHEGHLNLYSAWAKGGPGVIVTGNVIVDRNYLEAPGNMVLDNTHTLNAYKVLASAVKSEGSHIWMQLNHPGPQSPGTLTPEPVAPSAVPARKPEFFNTPRALTSGEIANIIDQFAFTALQAKNAGFDGVQVHASYGYLLSSFLSPRTNQRNDKWGGSLENRTRLLRTIVQSIRENTGTDFAVTVRINVSDYLPNGFKMAEAVKAIQWLETDTVDLVDLSGGSYDRSISFERKYRDPGREDLFTNIAKQVKKAVSIPVMITGTLRSGSYMNSIIEKGWVDAVGMARPLLCDVEFPVKLVDGFMGRVEDPRYKLEFRSPMERIVKEIFWYYEQIYRLSIGSSVDLNVDMEDAFMSVLGRENALTEGVLKRRESA
jgi:2,4-dienoyl-CoA reductase-like NADH-dependent reductase (Old Yellow Enzyme family)